MANDIFTYGLKFIKNALREEPHPPPCGEAACTWCWFEADTGFIDEQIEKINNQHDTLLGLVKDMADALENIATRYPPYVSVKLLTHARAILEPEGE